MHAMVVGEQIVNSYTKKVGNVLKTNDVGNPFGTFPF